MNRRRYALRLALTSRLYVNQSPKSKRDRWIDTEGQAQFDQVPVLTRLAGAMGLC